MAGVCRKEWSEVSKTFKISKSSLQKRLKQNSYFGPSLGRIPVFSANKEKQLAEYVIHLSKLFYGISKQEIKKCAYEYAEKNNMPCPFKIKIQKLHGMIGSGVL